MKLTKTERGVVREEVDATKRRVDLDKVEAADAKREKEETEAINAANARFAESVAIAKRDAEREIERKRVDARIADERQALVEEQRLKNATHRVQQAPPPPSLWQKFLNWIS